MRVLARHQLAFFECSTLCRASRFSATATQSYLRQSGRKLEEEVHQQHASYRAKLGRRAHHSFHKPTPSAPRRHKTPYCNHKVVLCTHTDASEKYWAVAATQCDMEKPQKPFTDQQHSVLAFRSSSFPVREKHRSTYERKAYAAVQAFRKVDYFLACDATTRVFTDPRNFLFAFNHVAIRGSLG